MLLPDGELRVELLTTTWRCFGLDTWHLIRRKLGCRVSFEFLFRSLRTLLMIFLHWWRIRARPQTPSHGRTKAWRCKGLLSRSKDPNSFRPLLPERKRNLCSVEVSEAYFTRSWEAAALLQWNEALYSKSTPALLVKSERQLQRRRINSDDVFWRPSSPQSFEAVTGRRTPFKKANSEVRGEEAALKFLQLLEWKHKVVHNELRSIYFRVICFTKDKAVNNLWTDERGRATRQQVTAAALSSTPHASDVTPWRTNDKCTRTNDIALWTLSCRSQRNVNVPASQLNNFVKDRRPVNGQRYCFRRSGGNRTGRERQQSHGVTSVELQLVGVVHKPCFVLFFWKKDDYKIKMTSPDWESRRRWKCEIRQIFSTFSAKVSN